MFKRVKCIMQNENEIFQTNYGKTEKNESKGRLYVNDYPFPLVVEELKPERYTVWPMPNLPSDLEDI